MTVNPGENTSTLWDQRNHFPALAFVLVISRFLNFIDPPELCFRPDSPFSKVVLPAPFAPIMAKKDPLFRVKVKSRTATIPP